jgi:ABC-type molybdenum transport system ATPase subunit/photorepair protein PhrA
MDLRVAHGEIYAFWPQRRRQVDHHPHAVGMITPTSGELFSSGCGAREWAVARWATSSSATAIPNSRCATSGGRPAAAGVPDRTVVDRMIERLALGAASRRASTLSLGNLQRGAGPRAAAHPELLVLDEAANGLDRPKSSRCVRCCGAAPP